MGRAVLKGLHIGPMRADPGLVATVSRWRHEAFLRDFGFTYEAAVRQLEDFLAHPSPQEAALLAELDGAPAGTIAAACVRRHNCVAATRC